MKKRRQRKLPVTRPVTPQAAVSNPLSNLRPDQIVSVTVGAEPDEDDHVSIDMMIPTEGGALASYEENILLEGEAPAYLRDAAVAFFDACCRAVRGRAVTKVRTCEACLGCCCYEFDRVDVSPADVQVLRNAGIDVAKMVNMFEDERGNPRTTLKGHVGILQKVDLVHPLSGETVSACPAFTGMGCSIYEHRPQACREFTMIGCDHFEPRPDVEESDGQDEDEPVEPTEQAVEQSPEVQG